MPIYEYRCQDCGKDFEKLVRSANSDGVRCPSCGEQHLALKLSTFAAHSGSSSKESAGPMCPSGGMCRTPGMCGLN